MKWLEREHAFGGLAGIPVVGGDSPLDPGYSERLADEIEEAYENLPDPCEHDRAFAELHGLRLDGRLIDYGPSGFSHLAQVAEDPHKDMTLLGAGQSGKTAVGLTKVTRWCRLAPGDLFGIYMPDKPTVLRTSSARFEPFILSSPTLAPYLGFQGPGRKPKNDVEQRALCFSTVFFMTTGGKTSTESVPLRGIMWDEVRRMESRVIQLTEIRQSAQPDPWRLRVSTAGVPESDIHAAFLAGDQHWFHTACKCPDGVVLSRVAEEALVDLTRAPAGVLKEVGNAYARAGLPYLGVDPALLEPYKRHPAAMRCPKCKTWITNPREGWWDADAPSHYGRSYQFGAHLSPVLHPSRLNVEIRYPKQPIDEGEVFRSYYGIPYLNERGRAVDDDSLRSCVDRKAEWCARMPDQAFLIWKRETKARVALGLDNMGGYGAAVLKRIRPDGRWETFHLEVVHANEANRFDPWEDVARLIEEYGVRVALTEALPNYDDAVRLAMRFKGRVWLANYSLKEEAADMLLWADRKHRKKGLKGKETGLKYTVQINQVKAMKWALSLWRRGLAACPMPNTLLQSLPCIDGRPILTAGMRRGDWEPVAICRDIYWDHLKRVAFREAYRDEEIGSASGLSVKLVKVGLDPHFAFAEMLAAVALSRIGGVPT